MFSENSPPSLTVTHPAKEEVVPSVEGLQQTYVQCDNMDKSDSGSLIIDGITSKTHNSFLEDNSLQNQRMSNWIFLIHLLLRHRTPLIVVFR